MSDGDENKIERKIKKEKEKLREGLKVDHHTNGVGWSFLSFFSFFQNQGTTIKNHRSKSNEILKMIFLKKILTLMYLDKTEIDY